MAASLFLGTFLVSSGLILAVAAAFYLKRTSALAWLCHGTDKGTSSGPRGRPARRPTPGRRGRVSGHEATTAGAGWSHGSRVCDEGRSLARNAPLRTSWGVRGEGPG